MTHWSVNEQAAEILEKEVIPNQERLHIDVFRLKNGATVLDMGIRAKGGFRAGRYFVEAGMGGLGRLRYQMLPVGDLQMPGLTVTADAPVIAEMSSYVAATKVQWKGKTQVISGPVRAIRRTDGFAASVPYEDLHPKRAVAGVQTESMPDEELAERIAETCGIDPDRLYIIAARTGCIVGAVQVCARNIEQTLPSLNDQGFRMKWIKEGMAATPIEGIVDDEETAYGRVNDCLIYGQETVLSVEVPSDEKITEILQRLTFDKNTGIFGTPFGTLFASCDRNWANVPREWDAPCKVIFFSKKSGKCYVTGSINSEVLTKDFLGEGDWIE